MTLPVPYRESLDPRLRQLGRLRRGVSLAFLACMPIAARRSDVASRLSSESWAVIHGDLEWLQDIVIGLGGFEWRCIN